jgi:hypothetical protein
VIDNPSKLSDFNSMDFSNQDEIKYIDGECYFATIVKDRVHPLYNLFDY